ncbi:MAG: hypothetical protein GQ570_08870 [Helicobacteraceae bacterium]|nr:hypothetical protein [Helicobacteraceae bacterium]
MKIAIKCDSPLLHKSLELLLVNHIVSYKNADVILSDQPLIDEDKKVLWISTDKEADIIKPFSPSQLMVAIERVTEKERKLETLTKIAENMDEDEVQTTFESSFDFDILEKRIKMLTQEYETNILNTVRAFYDK